MTDEMKEASLRQGSDNTRKGLGISRMAFVMRLCHCRRMCGKKYIFAMKVKFNDGEQKIT